MGITTYPYAEIPSQGGESGKYLTTDGNVPSWGSISAGGMTLLGTASMSGITSYTFSSIPQTYNKLYVKFASVFPGTSGEIYMRVNGISGASCYVYSFIQSQSTTVTNTGGTFIRVSLAAAAVWGVSGGMTFHDYTTTTYSGKHVNWNVSSQRLNSSQYTIMGMGTLAGVTANNYDGFPNISSIQFYENNGNNFSSGSIYLYGEK